MPSLELQAAISELYGKKFRREDHALVSAEFAKLVETCRKGFLTYTGRIDRDYAHKEALRNFFRNAGAPWNSELVRSVEETSSSLENAYRQTMFEVTHFWPFDFSVHLPTFQFGPCAVREFTRQDLEEAFKAYRNARFGIRPVDSKRLSQFQWLTITESVEKPFKHRVFAGFIYFPGLNDVGKVFPHGKHYTVRERIFDQCLFVLSLFGWEEISHAGDSKLSWQPFQLPISFAVDDDLFGHPQTPPDPNRLSWDERPAGPDESYEVPWSVDCPDGSLDDLPEFARQGWDLVERVCPIKDTASFPAFNRLVKHFFLRAFREKSDIEEFIWHTVTVDAALGKTCLSKDGKPKNEQRHTAKIASRIWKLLNDPNAGPRFENFYNDRSAYVHGRDLGGRQMTMGDLRALRGIARQVVFEVLKLVQQHPDWSRDDMLNYLDNLKLRPHASPLSRSGPPRQAWRGGEGAAPGITRQCGDPRRGGPFRV